MQGFLICTAAAVLTTVTAAPVSAGCSKHGTEVLFADTPNEAAALAKKEQKLVFVLHVSGHFEDPRHT
jgi:hypothetical protein